MTNEVKEEVIKEGVVINKEPGYLYYINKSGDVCKRQKAGLRKYKKTKSDKAYSKVFLNIPTIMLHGYISNGFKKVYPTNTGAMMSVPKRFASKQVKVILLIKEDLVTNGLIKEESSLFKNA